jgi:opacity protein-like surface antigen
MNRKTGLFASFAVVAVLLLRPAIAAADVVPPRKEKAGRDAASVEARLATLGVDAATAKASAERLTSDELRYFSEDPSRIQTVGGLTWYEVLGGVVVGTAVAAAAFLLAEHAIQ